MGNLPRLEVGSKGRALLARLVFALLAAAWLAAPAPAADLRVVLEAEGGVRSDGNYAQIEQDPELEGEDEENLARAGFNLRLSYELPRLTLALGYFPSYEWILDNADVNGTTHRLDLGLTANLTRRLELRVRERLLSSPNIDLYSPFLATEPLAVPQRGDQLTHSLDVALDQDLTRRVVLLLGAAHTLRTFESEDLSDTETLSARIGAAFQPMEDRRFEVFATAGNYDFGSRSRPVGEETEREADVRTLNLAWHQPFFRDGRFRVEGGMFAVDSTRTLLVPAPDDGPPTEVTEDFEQTGWRGGLELSRQLELLGWNVGVRHDVSAGVGLGRATEVDSAFAGISTNIGRRLVLGLDGNFSRHQDLEDEDPVVILDRPGDRAIETAAGTARVSWSFSTIARLTGGYSRVWQESQVAPFEDLSYSRYFLGLALQLYRSGEEPEDPARQGETEDDDEPDAQ
ncbi:MAG TPA: hypothetical protein VN493_16210 [Thermoanaerobaculia bacterium]|nr:hypothetical protein [Thermoanaerobaculia bacterium]